MVAMYVREQPGCLSIRAGCVGYAAYVVAKVSDRVNLAETA